MTKKHSILLVEDNEKLNQINCRALELEGFFVLCAQTISMAREICIKHSPAVILLDISLPDGDGMEFCREIRELCDAHIIFLTARSEFEDKIQGLDVGGDDYITKPYHPKEMTSRVKAAMRRRGMDKKPQKTLRHGHLELNTFASRAFVDGEDLMLSAKEFALLHLLLQHENQVLSAESVYEEIWETSMNGDNRPLKTRICGLRKKMDSADCEYTINAVYGQGYCFERV